MTTPEAFVLKLEEDCPLMADHNQPGKPGDETKLREWAAKMRRTHTQKRCQGCGLWVIWEKK
jgi:hypothetical protein